MDKIKIREATEKDFQVMVEIAKNDGYMHPNKLNLEWLNKRKGEGDLFFIAEFNGKEVGFVVLQKKFAIGSKLHFLSVKEEFQHKGVGAVLVKKAEEETKKLGNKKIFLYTHYKNFNAIRFYSKNDYYVNGVFIDKYGVGENAILMCRDLE